jgi:hypothetical protein
MKYYWFSAYDEQTGQQFGYTTRAVDTLTAMDDFYANNPNSSLASYGYYDEEEEED